MKATAWWKGLEDYFLSAYNVRDGLKHQGESALWDTPTLGAVRYDFTKPLANHESNDMVRAARRPFPFGFLTLALFGTEFQSPL